MILGQSSAIKLCNPNRFLKKIFCIHFFEKETKNQLPVDGEFDRISQNKVFKSFNFQRKQ